MSSDVVLNLQDVLANIENVRKEINAPKVTLVAVSKTKSADYIKQCVAAGHTVFGENYVNELEEKCPQIPQAQFHMIGHLQSNKCKTVASLPNVVMVETIDSEKLAKMLNKECEKIGRKMDVLIEVNTSAKSGIPPTVEDFCQLASFIYMECPALQLKGLMTIGDQEEATRDFTCLREIRDKAVIALNKKTDELILSMGMSHDYDVAMRNGSTNVRVGSKIFGARVYHK